MPPIGTTPNVTAEYLTKAAQARFHGTPQQALSASRILDGQGDLADFQAIDAATATRDSLIATQHHAVLINGRLIEVTPAGHTDPSHRLALQATDDIDTVLLQHTGMVLAGTWHKEDALHQTAGLTPHALACPTCVDGCDCEAGSDVDCGHYGCWSAPGATRAEKCAFAEVLCAA
jgi:hypothetical protein